MIFSHITVIRDKQLSLNMNVMELENDIKSMGICPFVHPCTTKQASGGWYKQSLQVELSILAQPNWPAQGLVFWAWLSSLNRGQGTNQAVLAQASWPWPTFFIFFWIIFMISFVKLKWATSRLIGPVFWTGLDCTKHNLVDNWAGPA